jgi:hypothetical protein
MYMSIHVCAYAEVPCESYLLTCNFDATDRAMIVWEVSYCLMFARTRSYCFSATVSPLAV